jgi:hypothetical protein
MAVKHIPMAHARTAIAANPRQFGRARPWLLDAPTETRWMVSDDLKLFAATFMGGFLFVSILIA